MVAGKATVPIATTMTNTITAIPIVAEARTLGSLVFTYFGSVVVTLPFVTVGLKQVMDMVTVLVG